MTDKKWRLEQMNFQYVLSAKLNGRDKTLTIQFCNKNLKPTIRTTIKQSDQLYYRRERFRKIENIFSLFCAAINEDHMIYISQSKKILVKEEELKKIE